MSTESAGGPGSSVRPPHAVALEIAVQDVAGVLAARAAGAQRVELCAALGATGGLTPSIGLLDLALTAAEDFTDHDPIEVHPLIRPRAGGFVHDASELAVMVADVRAAVDAGAHGVVVGVLTADGEVDAGALRQLVAAAEGREVTFHRALDMVPDPLHALDVLAALGVARVLTSGGAQRTVDGLERLAHCVRYVHDEHLPLQVQAGGGVRVADIAAIVGAGVDAVHLSAKTVRVDAGGPGGGSGDGYEVTDEILVAAARDALDAALEG
ncbi:copper homeostasis protein CutC [Luteimicrobium subarcticum]|uniref:PF03932 family protein CutC n=1 Tax=Luteimicrobium subarcticum TaxID=620910 RepID=A0A2M8WSA9_9MICO|nr:copper homeostasis protein CutC [Luteimicrobium subarcticum]PJI93831.1 copper homeostasis protein [Luteimicrobium subarcticum]